MRDLSHALYECSFSHKFGTKTDYFLDHSIYITEFNPQAESFRGEINRLFTGLNM